MPFDRRGASRRVVSGWLARLSRRRHERVVVSVERTGDAAGNHPQQARGGSQEEGLIGRAEFNAKTLTAVVAKAEADDTAGYHAHTQANQTAIARARPPWMPWSEIFDLTTESSATLCSPPSASL